MEGTTTPIVEEFNGWLTQLVDSEGSDVHIKVGSAPMMRMPAGLVRLDRSPLSNEETDTIAEACNSARRPILL